MAITRPYTPQEWENGDVITKEKLDNIEAGIAAIDTEITGARGSGASAGTLGKRIDDLVMVQDTQPTSEANEIWVRSTGNGVQVPTYEEFETLTNNTVHVNETQSLTDTQKETARGNMGAASVGEVSDLRNDITDINTLENDLLTDSDWEEGTINTTTGADSWSNTTIRTGYIPLSDTNSISITVDSGYKYLCVLINELKNAVVNTAAWGTGVKKIDLLDYPTAKYIRIALKKTDNTKPDSSEYVHAAFTNDFLDFVGNTNEVCDDFARVNALSGLDMLRNCYWEFGQVNTTTGADSWSDTRIRTNYLDVPEGAISCHLYCDNGWKYYAVLINADKTSVVSTINWATRPNDISLTNINAKYMRIVLQRTDYTVDVSDGAHMYAEYQTALMTALNDLVYVESNDVILYFVNNGVPQISDLMYSNITVTLTSNNLRIYDGVGQKEFTPDNILTAAAAFGLTVDTTNKTFNSSAFSLVYNYSTRGIYFKNPYSKIGRFEIELLSRIYTSYIGGLIYELITQNEVNNNSSAINDLNTEVFPQVPDYYNTQIETVINSVKSDLQTVGRYGDNFVFITDIHWSGNFKHSPELIRKLSENKLVNLIVNGGDLIDGSTNKNDELERQTNCINAFNKAGIPMITAKGNHDMNSGYGTPANYFSENEYFATAQHGNALVGMEYDGDCYFYWDKKSTKTRYIVLDSGANNVGDGIKITAGQILWIQTVIENTPADYHIIVVVHALGAYQSTTNPVGDSNKFVYYTGTQDLLDVLDDLLPSHMIEAVFFGHTHYDANYTTEGGIPLISTNSDSRHQYYGMPSISDGNVNSQCFDVVTIDYTAKKIYLRRVGRGTDRIISY